VSDGRIVCADNLDALARLGDRSVQLIYIDPPFNTGTEQSLRRLRTVADPEGERVGFGARRYRAEEVGRIAYDDCHDDYLGFLEPRLQEAHRVLAEEGTLYVHLDPRESHYVKVMLDGIFGRDCFLNEIVWAYDFGGRSKRRWPAKHDVILVYVRDPRRYHFDSAAVDREPYMAPGLVGPEKAAKGKLPTDVWWHTIVPTHGAERTGYPTQKPEGIVRRIVTASSRPGDLCLDFFAGSGTLGAVARELGRDFLLVDSNPEAISIMERRLGLVADRLAA
jgi:site-specific DNA-methyltransferase (adenine-specific)